MNNHSRSLIFALSLLAALAAAPSAHAAPAKGSLVKLACGPGANVNDPCKAVYYYAQDGKRHAFPNDKVYFSWYADFSAVQTISSSEMAALPLGSNVTYRPGSRPVKFMTDPKTYVVGLGGSLRWLTSEAAATALYGSGWAQETHDIPDTFFLDYRFGDDVAASSDFDPAQERAYAGTIDDDLPATKRSVTVATSGGSFVVDVLKLQKDRFRMITAAVETTDCGDDCGALPLKTYAEQRGAKHAIHGTYFCPPDYADCDDKTNTFLWPLYDSTYKVWRNAGSIPVHEGPMIVAHTDGTVAYFHRTEDIGSSPSSYETATGKTIDAAIANYPSLVEDGALVVESEAKLDDGMRTIKGTRGAIGMNERYFNLVIARSATVVDLARVMQALGMRDAMNLDGGGSAALLYDGAYVVGPGRQLPNAILFAEK
jgi:hypothetical protein